MKTAASLALLSLASVACAQNATSLADLAGALTSAGLTQLVTVATSLNGSAKGQQLLANLTNGEPHVVFAPNNNAWKSVPSNVTGDLLANVFSYHIVPGNFTGASTTYPNVTLGQTLLNDPSLVSLEGGRPQVVAWATRADGKVHVLNQRNDSTVLNQTSFGNLTILTVDHVLIVPGTLEETIPADNTSLAGFETLLRNATDFNFFNASTNTTANISWFDALNSGFSGFTLFAPNTSAIQSATSAIAGLNTSELTNVYLNHWINASTLYSPQLTGSSNFTSAAGEGLSFSINSTGQYVTSGNVTAKIIQPDVLTDRGVIHVIDTLLLNTESDSSAASSALSSAASAATQTAAQTAPIGFSQTQSLNAPSGSASAGSGGSNGAVSVGAAGKGLLVAVAGVVAGAWMTLF